MTREQAAERSDVTPERGGRRFDVSERPYQFEVIPLVCTVAEVCHFLRLSERQFSYLMARKDLAIVELQRIDRTRRFSGESVAAEIKRRSRFKVS